MTEKKITKREYYAQLLALDEVAANAELTAFIKHEVELLDKKNGARKPTERQVENANIKEIIVDMLAKSKPMTVTEIIKVLEAKGMGNFSTQRISPMMRQLVLDETVERVTEKRVTRFKVAGE